MLIISMPPELHCGTMASDIVMKGNLRKAKSWSKRFFVLRDGSPAQLECYENERKWKTHNSKPKRIIRLEKPWNIDKKKDSKHEFLIVIFTETEYFSMAADTADVQESWVIALQRVVKHEAGCVPYKHMWHVLLDNKELEGCKNNLMSRLHGAHLACLTHDQLILIKADCNGGADLNHGDPVEIPIGSIRVCGHHKECFFIQPGRASGIGNGQLLMNVHDEVMANNMHHTILKLMYLKQEEANAARNRSSSSGSNSGRLRTLRSHLNNPPPSLVGMGKVANNFTAFGKRIRCDSLPAPHVAGLHDPRFRTGSEGEHTLRKSSRFNTVRSHNGSVSPNIHNRLWMMQGRRNSAAHHRHYPSANRSYASSLSGSLNTSSAASSVEQLTNATDLYELNPSDPTLMDDYSVQRSGSICRHTNSYQGSWTPPIQEGVEVSRLYCSGCLTHIPSNQLSDFKFQSSSPEQVATPPEIDPVNVPPPPESDPPPKPLVVNDYENMTMHSRTISNCQTAHEQRSVRDDSSPATSLPSTPKRRPSLSLSNESPVDPCDEGYTAMNFNHDSVYPHQKMSLSSHTSNHNNCEDLTHKSIPVVPHEDGYVPMRSLIAQSSNNTRRRSMPDTSFRNTRSSPPLSTPTYCQECCQRTSYLTTSDRSHQVTSCHNSEFDTKDSHEVERRVVSNRDDTDRLVAPVSDETRTSTPSPTNKACDDHMDMHNLDREVDEIKRSMEDSRHNPSTVCDAIGYLPMNPVNPCLTTFRKNVFSSILSVAEGKTSSLIYPHQRKDRAFVANTLDRPHKSLRLKRRKSLTFRRASSFTRRSQSMKQKSTGDLPHEPRNTSPHYRAASPGGDYVNIDFRKAR